MGARARGEDVRVSVRARVEADCGPELVSSARFRVNVRVRAETRRATAARSWSVG